MTITLTPELTARLQDRAQREGGDVNQVAEALIATALDWETRDSEEAIAGVLRGEQAASDGRERSLTAFLAEQRIKHNFAADWPHGVADVQNNTDHA